MAKTYRVFPDYGATGVWGEIGDNPYVIPEDQLRMMGATMETLYLLRKMIYVYEESDLDESHRFPEEIDGLKKQQPEDSQKK